MTSGSAQEKTGELPGGLFGLVTTVFTSGMTAAQKLSETAATLPWTVLEHMGVPEDRTRGPKEFNLKLVGGVFRLTNKMTNKVLQVAAAPARWLGAGIQPSGTGPTDNSTLRREKRQAGGKAAGVQRARKTAGTDKDNRTTTAVTQREPERTDSDAKQTRTAKFNFTQNAEAIYDKSISATPLPFRKNTRDGLTKLLLERFGENAEISEADMVAIIREHTPKAFVAKGMKAIKPLLSDPSLAE